MIAWEAKTELSEWRTSAASSGKGELRMELAAWEARRGLAGRAARPDGPDIDHRRQEHR
jgi:hypothetical protein